MSNFKKLSAYVDVPCEWVSAIALRNDNIDQLKAENAKLREQLADAEHDESVAWDRVRKAEAGSDRLRELVRDMSECMDNSQPHCRRCKFKELDCQWFKFIDRMRELGVEVDK